MFGKRKQYKITGREREQLAEIQKGVAMLTAQFQALVGFVAKREQIDLGATLFNADELTFIPKPKSDQPA